MFQVLCVSGLSLRGRTQSCVGPGNESPEMFRCLLETGQVSRPFWAGHPKSVPALFQPQSLVLLFSTLSTIPPSLCMGSARSLKSSRSCTCGVALGSSISFLMLCNKLLQIQQLIVTFYYLSVSVDRKSGDGFFAQDLTRSQSKY